MAKLTPDAESRFRTIFEAAGVAISLVNANGLLVECNPAMVAMFGYSAEELLHMSFRDLSHPVDIAESAKKFAEIVAGEVAGYQMEKRYLRRDGQVIWGVLTVSAIPEPSGNPMFVMGIVEDITGRKRSEEDLRDRLERMEASIEASNTGLWDWNLKTNEVYYSTEWKRQLVCCLRNN